MTSPATEVLPSAGGLAKHGLSAREVAFAFIRKYYATLQSHSEGLYLFYTNESTMLHGTEGQAAEQFNGRKEICQKIADTGHENSLVCVTNVDTLPSLGGGIFIQVIGEMSNRGEPSRKFTQSFFLAKQENGYYLLNDVFRYLKEAVDEECREDCEDLEEWEDGFPENQTPEDDVDSAPLMEVFLPQPAETVVEERPLTPPLLNVKEPPPVVHDAEMQPEHEDLESSVARLEAGEPGNDNATDVEAALGTTQPAVTRVTESATFRRDLAQLDADCVAPSTYPEEIASVPAPGESTPREILAQQERSPCHPSPAPCTWAGVVIQDADKWKKDTLADVKGTSFTPAQPHPVIHPHLSDRQNNSHSGLSQSGNVSNGFRDLKDRYHSNEISSSIYVRYIPNDLTTELLGSVFAQFGEVINCDVILSKNTAFVDFAAVESALRAAKQREVRLPSGVVVVAEEKRAKQNRTAGGHGGYFGGRGRGRGRSALPHGGAGK